MASSAAEVELVNRSRSAERLTRSRKSGAMRSLSDSSSWEVVSWQYSAVLSTRHAVWSSCVLGRPSPDERRSVLPKPRLPSQPPAIVDCPARNRRPAYLTKALPRTSSAKTLSHLR